MKNLAFSAILLLLPTLVFATGENIHFNSNSLNEVVTKFSEYSPDLVEYGKVEVAYCGAYGAIFSLEKFRSSELAKENLIVPGDPGLKNIDYTALELKDDALNNLIQQIYSLNFKGNLNIGRLNKFSKKDDGVIFSYLTNTAVIWDKATNEYLVFSGATWQDDCD